MGKARLKEGIMSGFLTGLAFGLTVAQLKYDSIPGKSANAGLFYPA